MTMAVAGGCATGTHLQSSWVKPDLGPTNFHKVVAIALSTNASRRRMMEEEMSSELRKTAPDVQAVPSYTIVSDADLARESRLKEEVNRAGFDGAVFMRVTDVSRQDSYVPGYATAAPVYYRTFWGYYRYWVPIAYEPGYVEHNTNVQVETEVYSTVNEGVLVYSAVSNTLNPSSPADLAAEVASVVAKDLRAHGLLRTERH
jgi:hypothetical protein